MPTSNDRRKLASRTRGLIAATASQIVIDGFLELGTCAEGEVHCPVCRYPAVRYDESEVKSLYIHEARAFPCASTERVLLPAEMIDALPPVRFA